MRPSIVAENELETVGATASPSRSPDELPYWKPASDTVPVAPEKEPWRVTPPVLVSAVPPVTTVAVACGVSVPQ